MSEGNALVLKVTLDDPFGRAIDKPYRVLAVPADWLLYDLARFIVDSFDFDFDHLFGFYDNIRNYAKSTEGYEYLGEMDEASEFEGVTGTIVSKAFDKKGKKMLFLFDYGDHWCFIVKVEDIVDAGEYEGLPCLIKSVGQAPPQYGEAEEEWDTEWDDDDDWSEDWSDDDWDDEWDDDDDL